MDQESKRCRSDPKRSSKWRKQAQDWLRLSNRGAALCRLVEFSAENQSPAQSESGLQISVRSQRKTGSTQTSDGKNRISGCTPAFVADVFRTQSLSACVFSLSLSSSLFPQADTKRSRSPQFQTCSNKSNRAAAVSRQTQQRVAATKHSQCAQIIVATLLFVRPPYPVML